MVKVSGPSRALNIWARCVQVSYITGREQVLCCMSVRLGGIPPANPSPTLSRSQAGDILIGLLSGLLKQSTPASTLRSGPQARLQA